MKTIHIGKAQATITTDPEIEGVTIVIGETIEREPRSNHDEKDERSWYSLTRARYRNDAKALLEALAHALPGGTLDQLLALHLERAASLHRVASQSFEMPLLASRVIEELTRAINADGPERAAVVRLIGTLRELGYGRELDAAISKVPR